MALATLACSSTKTRSSANVLAGGDGGNAGSSAIANGGTGGTTQESSTTVDDVPVVIDGEFPVPLAEGLAPTPPMGWSSWNRFACNITEASAKSVADAMVSNGMKDAGYTFVNIDDCWQAASRAADGTVVPDPDFPSGMKALADYLHERGLKLGLYSDRGTETCAHRAGAIGHERQDAESYAAFGIDYLKYDNCAADEATIEQDYKLMRTELDRATAPTGRPIVYSICAWSFYEWAIGIGQLWRTTMDITASWLNSDSSKGSVLASLVRNADLAAYAGPGGWNDPDMLEVGNSGLNFEESKSHFGLWAMMAAPLIAGNDLSTMTSATKSILTNREVIAVDQDALGLQGVVVSGSLTDAKGVAVLAKPLNGPGERAVLLLNRNEVATDVAVSFDTLGLGRSPVRVTDLWANESLGTMRDSYIAKSVPAHGSVMLKIVGVEPSLPSGTAYLSDLHWVYAANGAGTVEKNLTNGAVASGDGKPIALEGTTYDQGLGTRAPSLILYRLGKACSRFKAKVGVPDQVTAGASVRVRVFGDGEKLYESAVLTQDSAPLDLNLDVTGKYRLKLFASSAGTRSGTDEVVWAAARVECN